MVSKKSARPKRAAKRTSPPPAKRAAKPAHHSPVKPLPKDKLDAILAQQRTILKNEEQIKKSESAIKSEEHRIERLEAQGVKLERETLKEERKEGHATSKTEKATLAAIGEENVELKRLEQLEEDIKKDVQPHPLTRVTTRDVAKGLVGAFIGVVVHFTFTYGVELAEHLTTQRAAFLYIFTLVIGGVFLYATGFRKIDHKSTWWLLPWRLLVLYSAAIVVTVATVGFFYPAHFMDPSLAFRDIAVINLSAVIGACTADLIGRD
jgi:uncharacterized membrane protein